MPEDIERLRAVSDCCDNAHKELSDAKAKVSQVAVYKENASKAGSSDQSQLYRFKAISDEAALKKLKTIEKDLGDAVSTVGQLCKEARKLLVTAVRPTAGPAAGLGMGGASVAEKEEDENEGSGEQ